LAALVGLIGGLGGAAIGGAIANEGQEQRAMDQREAQLQDLAIETYSSYVRIAGTAYIRLAGDVSTSEAQKAGLIGVVEGGQAEVAFLTADPEVVTTADRLEQLLAGLAPSTIRPTEQCETSSSTRLRTPSGRREAGADVASALRIASKTESTIAMDVHCDSDAPPSRSRARSPVRAGAARRQGPRGAGARTHPTLTNQSAAQENPTRNGPRDTAIACRRSRSALGLRRL
jgi:hypothetical protein